MRKKLVLVPFIYSSWPSASGTLFRSLVPFITRCLFISVWSFLQLHTYVVAQYTTHIAWWLASRAHLSNAIEKMNGSCVGWWVVVLALPRTKQNIRIMDLVVWCHAIYWYGWGAEWQPGTTIHMNLFAPPKTTITTTANTDSENYWGWKRRREYRERVCACSISFKWTKSGEEQKLK